MEFSRKAASEIDLIIAQLAEKIDEMESNFENSNLDLLNSTKINLNEFMNEKAKACIFRSKCQFAELGEKPTSYYLSMEKDRYNIKTCNALYNRNNKIITSTEGILKIQESFYSELYVRDQSVVFDVTNTYDVYVPHEYKKVNNAPFTVEEIGHAVRALPNNKTCGNDGLPIEFYKAFWSKLKNIFLALINQIYEEKHLHSSALIGVINLIPKPLHDSKNLKHHCPITLLNSDYKVVEKMLAIRIEPALNTIISDDQRGFRKGRRICCNIRTIYELMKYTEKK